MNLDELAVELDTTLQTLFVNYKKETFDRDDLVKFIVPDFGVVVYGMNKLDYSLAVTDSTTNHNDYRFVYVTTDDLMHERKYDIIWALMRGGYMRHIRVNYKRQFTHLVVLQDFGRRIIAERLRIWDNQAKYKYLIQVNNEALAQGATLTLTHDPSFYDMLPEDFK